MEIRSLFWFRPPSTVKVGFGIQAPLGDDCEGKLDFITLSDDSVENFRDGS